MVQVKHDASDNAAVRYSPCVSELHQHPAGSGRSRKDPGREESWVGSDGRRSQTHLAQCASFQTFPLSAMWCGKKIPKTNLKVAAPHVGDTPGTNVFAAFCQLEERGGGGKPDV